MQDADQPVGESAEGLVVGGAAGSSLVVERACSWGVVERGEGLQEQRVAEAAVSGVAGQNHPLGAGDFGDR